MSAAEGTGRVTRLLLDWRAGDESAMASLLPLVYDELRTLAARHLRRERHAHTLQRTALVHEAYMRLIDQTRVDWQSRAQFFAIASRMMRRVLVDHARKHLAQKRGGGLVRVELEPARPPEEDPAAMPDALALTGTAPVDLSTIDEALQKLERMDPRQGKVVELRFFGGLSIEDTADALGISPATVKREWVSARAWLQRELGEGRP